MEHVGLGPKSIQHHHTQQEQLAQWVFPIRIRVLIEKPAMRARQVKK